VGECFFWYRPTRVVPDKRPLNGWVCVCVPSLWRTLLECSHVHSVLDRLPSLVTQVSRYQKGKTNLDFTEARDSEWQWHQLGHMQTDDHASTPPLSFYRPDALPATQPTASKH